MFRRDESDHIKLASQILREAREELGRADGKAGLLLAAAGVGIGAVLAGLLAQDWDPAKLHDSIEWLWWLGTIAGLCGPVALSCAVWPRTTYRKNRNPKKVAFFGDVVGLSGQDLESRLRCTADSPGLAVIDQLELVSRIVDKKYRWIQRGLLTLGFGAGASLLSVFISSWL